MGDDDRSSPPSSSPALVRQATVVRRCRDFYARRLQTSEALRRKWHHHRGSGGSDSECSSTLSSTSSAEDTTTKGENVDTDSGVDDVKEPVPCRRKSLSSVDLAMDSLRKEISSLIECDNALFCQLLNLYDSITELRQQRARHSVLSHDDDDDVDDIGLHSPRTRGSLESLSAYEDDEEDEALRRRVASSSTSSSPSCECSGSSGLEDAAASSDVSRSSSNSASVKVPARNVTVQGQQGGKRHSAMVGLGCRDRLCTRCLSVGTKKRTPVYRRRPVSYAGPAVRHNYTDSFDSGIHLHGDHSESDHEIFV